MAWQFPTDNDYAERSIGAWMDGATTLWAAVFGRVDSLYSPAREQWLFAVRGSTGHFGIRRDDDGTWKARCYTAGLSRYATGSAVVLGQTYHLVMRWTANVAGGIEILEDGVLEGSATTSGQASFAPGSGTSLYLGCQGYQLNPGRCTVESLVIGRDRLPTDREVEALRQGVWPQSLGLAGGNVRHWGLWGDLVTLGPELLARDLPILGTGIHGAVDGGRIGRLEDPGCALGGGASVRLVDSGPPPPPPAEWEDWPETVVHPAHSIDLEGLDEGDEYEFRVRAVDASLASAWSSVASCVIPETPTLPTAMHSPRWVLRHVRT